MRMEAWVEGQHCNERQTESTEYRMFRKILNGFSFALLTLNKAERFGRQGSLTAR